MRERGFFVRGPWSGYPLPPYIADHQCSCWFPRLQMYAKRTRSLFQIAYGQNPDNEALSSAAWRRLYSLRLDYVLLIPFWPQGQMSQSEKQQVPPLRLPFPPGVVSSGRDDNSWRALVADFLYSGGVREKLTANGAPASRNDPAQRARRVKRWRRRVQMANQPSAWRIFLPSPAERGV
jgi:hypothetical protein